MSHFTTLVFLPRGKEYSERAKYVESVLAPYCEDLEVSPYEDKCGCVGLAALTHAIEVSREKFNVDAKREEFQALESVSQVRDAMGIAWGNRNSENFSSEHNLVVKLSDFMDSLWETYTAEFFEEREAFKLQVQSSHPEFDKPDPNCGECGGSGKIMSTHNPNSKWDWYCEGGRGQHFFGDGAQPIAPVSFVLDNLEECTPFAFVTPDGEWHESAKMGWWAVTSDTDDDYQEEFKKALHEHRDLYVVIISCHI